MKKSLKVLALSIAINGWTTIGSAGPETCDGQYWPGSLPEHEVDSVPRETLEQFLKHLPAADGIGFQVLNNANEIQLDIVSYPGNVSVAASTRVLFIVGRVTKPGYRNLVLADNGRPLFKISYESIHRIGCQFIWGEQGGQNPIALMREFIDNLRYYDGDARVAPIFPGSLFGDTNLAIGTLNGVVTPKWVMGTVRVE